MKTLSIIVPAYNSQDYLHVCLDSLVIGGPSVEVVVVDDGSTDNTAKIAKEYCKKYPDIVRLEQKENGGHGSAVNRGLKVAKGLYFKVVDSDDWFDKTAYLKVLSFLKEQQQSDEPVDLVLANYVYEYSYNNTRKVVSYGQTLPHSKVFGWDEVGLFRIDQYLLMHSMIYRTQVLRDCKLQLPEHTFYVDNLVAYIPLPYVKTMYYINVNLYRYFIGRADQSVNTENMIKRIDQQLRVNKIMIQSYHLYSDIQNRKMRRYMMHYLSIITAASLVHLRLSKKPEDYPKIDELWQFMRDYDRKTYRILHSNVINRLASLPGKSGRSLVQNGYDIIRKIYKFN